jgi:uncharacterized protein with HEPN domain
MSKRDWKLFVMDMLEAIERHPYFKRSNEAEKGAFL